MITSIWQGDKPSLLRLERQTVRELRAGARVRLTEAYFRATASSHHKPESAYAEWQQVWTVQECSCLLCRSGSFVAVDEASAIWEGLRHMQVVNLQDVGVDALEIAAAE